MHVVTGPGVLNPATAGCSAWNWRRRTSPVALGGLLLCTRAFCLWPADVDHIVIRVAVDQFVVRVDPGPGRLFAHSHHDRLRLPGQAPFLQVERLLLVFWAGENTDIHQ